MRFFTTEGPVNCADHYCLPPLTRFDLEEVLALIAQKKYFLLHAPRQTGKTTCLLALADHLNRHGDYIAVYANIEAAQALREDVAQALATAVTYIATSAATLTGDSIAVPLMQEVLETSAPGAVLGVFLTRWCAIAPKPVVLLLDEVDALVGDTLISLLRQLRAGYPTRPHAFPQSLILCGVRDLQDYRIQASSEKSIITGGSAFNIKAESLRLGDFVRPEVEALLLEHTHETGQEGKTKHKSLKTVARIRQDGETARMSVKTARMSVKLAGGVPSGWGPGHRSSVSRGRTDRQEAVLWRLCVRMRETQGAQTEPKAELTSETLVNRLLKKRAAARR